MRDVSAGREWLCPSSNLEAACHGQRIAVAETRLADQLSATILRSLHAADALEAVLRRLREGGSDVSLTDANYVREESDIYRKPTGAMI